ncbi:hypothetical protein EIP91_010921 [Steccherinum ochraceum]|uniref:FAD-binding PCMH-type domain-containing protein n=1 Tax=Steccherinum ochraceum TaxID=92696 RepID=A0A4R0R2M1_9APHY|nr:hypothetical protein EIP91_010921 [Steccherinum ochraceum]
MRCTSLWKTVFFVVAGLVTLRGGDVVATPVQDTANNACTQIAHAVSSASGVFFPSDPTSHYASDVEHWAITSSQNSTCSVEPGTAKDLGSVLQILGRTRTSFAVKGGGHATNPGFSSTKGVQISLARFNGVTYNANTQTADVGAGLVWDDVYTQLLAHGVIAIGGRMSGVGVAGFSLGGGYSYLTNQHGLGHDNIVAYELVLPSGAVTTVTETSNSDLFFALRGGWNNFGIVTKFTMKTYPQGQVWGGIIEISSEHLDAVNAATLNYIENAADPKSALAASYVFSPSSGLVSLLVLFYSEPSPPSGLFDDFLSIPAIVQDISTRSYVSLVQSVPETANLRTFYHTVPHAFYDASTLNTIVNETSFWGEKLANDSFVSLTYVAEPFLPTILTHSTSPTAWPPSRNKAFLPTNVAIKWSDPAADTLMHDSISASVQNVINVANQDGQGLDNAPFYGNYALFSTPVQSIYGSNLGRLKKIKATYDPQNVMSLAGGWKI